MCHVHATHVVYCYELRAQVHHLLERFRRLLRDKKVQATNGVAGPHSRALYAYCEELGEL